MFSEEQAHVAKVISKQAADLKSFRNILLISLVPFTMQTSRWN